MRSGSGAWHRQSGGAPIKRSLHFKKQLRLAVDEVSSLSVRRVGGKNLKDAIGEVHLCPATVVRGCGNAADPVAGTVVDVAREDLCERRVVDGLPFDQPALCSSALNASPEGVCDEGLVDAWSQIVGSVFRAWHDQNSLRAHRPIVAVHAVLAEGVAVNSPARICDTRASTSARAASSCSSVRVVDSRSADSVK